MDLLKKRERTRAAEREELRLNVRAPLRQALHERLPGQPVFVFGSINLGRGKIMPVVEAAERVAQRLPPMCGAFFEKVKTQLQD